MSKALPETTMTSRLSTHSENWQYEKTFRITGRSYDSCNLVIVELCTDRFIGRGEAIGVHYLGEDKDSILEQIRSVAEPIEQGITREELLDLLPAGGARNAIDCALWDLESKVTGKSVWELSGVKPGTVTTVLTIGIEETPQLMAQYAAEAAEYPLLKIKLDGNQPLERMQAIRQARPDARLVIDANQGWSMKQLIEITPALEKIGVEMIEQPLARGQDAELEGYCSPIPLYADESCQHRGEFSEAAKRYQGINIKLDKTGGLTEALLLAKEVQAAGMGLMVGSMGGNSLTMAPAFVVAQMCNLCDIDGPLLLKNDASMRLNYAAEQVSLPSGLKPWCL